MHQVLIVSKYGAADSMSGFANLQMSLSRDAPGGHTLTCLQARGVMYKSETEWLRYKAQWQR